MDEEQSNKKINISSFFERVDSVDEVASNALSKSNANFSAINNLQMLIQNISMSINEIRNDVREIANYIIVEKKLEMDRQLDEKFEAQDEKQKKEMLDRAKALGQPAPSTPQQKEEPVTAPKGGFLSGLLKAIAIGGIVALAAPLLPVIAPMILGALKVAFTALILGVVGKELIKLLPKIGKKIKEGYDASVKFAKETAAKINERINVIKDSIGEFFSKKKEQFLNATKNVVAFGKEKIGQVKDIAGDIKDKVVDKGSKFVEGAKDKLKNVAGDIKERGAGGIALGVADTFTGGIFDFDKKGDTKLQDFQQSVIEKGKETVGAVGEKIKEGRSAVLEKMKEGRKNLFKGVTKLADAATGNVFDLDKSGEGKTGILRAITGIADQTASLIGLQTDFDGKGSTKPDSGTGLQPIVQADAPQQSMASLLPTKSPVPFIKVLDNPYLSKVPTRSNTNEIPPEIAKLIA